MTATVVLLLGAVGALAIAGLVLVATVLLVFGVIGLVRWGHPDLEQALSAYQVAGADTETGSSAPPPVKRGSLVQSRVMTEVMDRFGAAAERRGSLDRVRELLLKANVPVRPAEALFLYLLGVVVGLAIGVIAGGPIGAIVGGVVMVVVPVVVLRTKADRRTRAFGAQLPDMLQMLAATLRSGFSLLQGLDSVARQIAEPMGGELRTTVAEIRLGRSLIDALADAGKRVGSTDFDWVVSAVRIQSEIGGNLAELLDVVAETMKARVRLRREIRVLTAQNRIATAMLGVMPVVMLVILDVLNPGYISPFIHSGAGQLLLGAAAVLIVLGLLWLRKIVDIEV
jgi:tight adherence protein B